MLKELDRAKLTENFFHPANIITADTICTIRAIDGDIAIVQYDFSNGMQHMAGFPLSLLSPINKMELINLLPERVIPKNYHIGNKFEVNGIVWTIIDINLAVNEMDDKLTLIHDDKQIAITRYNLDKQMSYVAFDEIEKTFNEPEMEFIDEVSLYKQTLQNSHMNTQEELKVVELNTTINEPEETKEEIKINIKGFDFTVIGEDIMLPSVKAGDAANLMAAFGTLQKLLNGGK